LIPGSLRDISPIIEPARLLQAVVAGLAWEMVQGVTEEVHVASLDGRLWEDPPDR
jgi:hypothetical protein